jgi:hypothetical protein
MFYHYKLPVFNLLFLCSFSLLAINDRLLAEEFDAVEVTQEVFECDHEKDYIKNLFRVGEEYERQTGKKFDYKKLLKVTYKKLEEMGVEVPDSIKKEVKQAINDYLKGHKASNPTLDRYRENEHRIDNSFRNDVIGFGVGVGLCCIPCGVSQTAGVGICYHFASRILTHSSNYFWEYHDSTSARRERERNSQGHSERRRKRRD